MRFCLSFLLRITQSTELQKVIVTVLVISSGFFLFTGMYMYKKYMNEIIFNKYN